jgi:starch-binding outer membrane protein, SusD/RagB family
MKTKNTFFIAAALLTLLTSCDDFLDREPLSSTTPSNYFSTADQLGSYVISYYSSVFPTYTSNYTAGPILGDADTDNLVYGDANTTKFVPGLWLVPASKNLDFTKIRAMNFFFQQVLPKYAAGKISGDNEDVRQYIGEAYYLRASLYFDKLASFGDFPIITDVLQDNADILTAASKRSPRNEVARFILADCDSAISYLGTDGHDKVRITRDLALLLKSRVALFEATFEKYHRGTGRVPGDNDWPGAAMSYNAGRTFDIPSEINYFLGQAMDASKQVADAHALAANSHAMNPGVQVYSGWNPYFEMFAQDDCGAQDEVLLWRDYDATLNVVHGTNDYIHSGGNNGATRSFVDAFLMKNGLPIYADGSGYRGDATIDEQKSGRDERLQLFVFAESDVRSNFADTAELFRAPALVDLLENRDRTGFRIRKHLQYGPDAIYGGLNSTNGLVVYRASEAYLNYIEASYLREGSVNSTADAYWRALRSRAGIDPDYTKTIAATDLAKEEDWAKYSGSELVDNTLYNIRRERRCEFIGENYRDRDLRRWRSYDAMLPGNMGAYIPEGINLWTKIYTYQQYFKKNASGAYTKKTALIEQAAGKTTANVSARTDSKYLRPYRVIKENNQVWDGYQWMKAYYLDPISVQDLQLTSPDGTAENSVMYQNPFWPVKASVGALE